MKKVCLSVFAALIFALSLGVGVSFAADGSHMEEGKAAVAIDGYCPVCITNGKYMKGSAKFSTEYNGSVYYFPGFDQQKMFLNDPENYLQDLGKKYEALKMKSEGSHKAEGSH